MEKGIVNPRIELLDSPVILGELQQFEAKSDMRTALNTAPMLNNVTHLLKNSSINFFWRLNVNTTHTRPTIRPLLVPFLHFSQAGL